MPEYECECCVFITMDKQKYNTHLLTNKHRKLFNDKEKSISNIMNDEIQKLREEVAYLKGKLEVYEKVFHKGGQEEEVPQKYEGEFEDSLIVFNKYRETFELDMNDVTTIESFAELKNTDEDVNHENFMDKFISNEANSLNHINILKKFIDGDKDAIHNFTVDILLQCKKEVTEKYKGRFKLYHGGEWKTVSESYDLFNDFVNDIRGYFRDCFKAMKIYYSYNHEKRNLDECDMIKPILSRLCRFPYIGLIDNHHDDPDERTKYIINKVSSYQ